MKNSYIHYFSRFIGKDSEKIIKYLLLYSHTWDTYGLALIYFNLANIIHNNNFDFDFPIDKFTKLLLNIIHPDAERRLTYDSIFREIDNIFGDI